MNRHAAVSSGANGYGELGKAVAMTYGVRDTQWVRRGTRVAAVGAAATAVAVAVVLGPVSGALASLRAIPGGSPGAAGVSSSGFAAGLLAGGSGAPAGWALVPYRRAQLSVPGVWLVETPGQFWCAPPSWSRA